MKYVVFFLLVCVALAAAAPQYITSWPGVVGPIGHPLGLRTIVAGPTTLNGATIGGRIITTNGLYGGNILI